jgi:hypothetical protein
MYLINSYQKGWALRYLREAKAELTAAKRIPYLAPSRLLESMRKAQAAIYYSLGDPASIEAIIHQTILQGQFIGDPLLRFLVDIELTVEQMEETPESDPDGYMHQADDMVQIATDIVKLFTD